MNLALSFALSLTLRGHMSRKMFPAIWSGGLVAFAYNLPGFTYNTSRCTLMVRFTRPGTDGQIYNFLEIANQSKKKMEYLQSLLNIFGYR